MTLALVAWAMMELVHTPLTITPHQTSGYTPLLIKDISERSAEIQSLVLSARSDGERFIRTSPQAFHTFEDVFFVENQPSQPNRSVPHVSYTYGGQTAKSGRLNGNEATLLVDHQVDGPGSFAGGDSPDSNTQARKDDTNAGERCRKPSQFEAGSCNLIATGNGSNSLPLSAEVRIRVIGVIIASLLILGGLLFVPYSIVRSPVRSYWWENGPGIGGIIACVGFFLLFECFLG